MKKEEFLAFSLPYGLKLIFEKSGKIIELQGLKITDTGSNIYNYGDLYYDSEIFNFKPILHKLSDLNKEIEHNGERFMPLHKLLEMNNFDLSKMSKNEINSYECVFNDIDVINFNDAMYLISIHFDIFDLISKNEAIDVNTLEFNPYK